MAKRIRPNVSSAYPGGVPKSLYTRPEAFMRVEWVKGIIQATLIRRSHSKSYEFPDEAAFLLFEKGVAAAYESSGIKYGSPRVPLKTDSPPDQLPDVPRDDDTPF